MQLFSVLITLFQFYAVQLCSAQWIFLCGLWLKTVESSWLLGISQRILGCYASYSWSGDLGFLRLMRLFPLIPLFSSLWCWKCRSGRGPPLPQLYPQPQGWVFRRLFQVFRRLLQSFPSPVRPLRRRDPIVVLAVVFALVGKAFKLCHRNRITLLYPEWLQLRRSIFEIRFGFPRALIILRSWWVMVRFIELITARHT